MGGSVKPDLHFLSQSKNGNRLFFGLVGIEYRRPLLFGFPKPPKPGEAPKGGENDPPSNDGGENKPPAPEGNPALMFHKPPFIPYVGISADLAIGEIRAAADGVHSGIRTGAVGSAFFGLNIGDNAFVEARYQQSTVIKSFDLSGVKLSAGIRFKF